ncbi:glucuronoarabinoxylan endo-1,4-beta-xylanase [Chryseobacterium taichungense]|uniref:Glucuronoarabinoxylan endo-1,4-beta-xylanase n=1 Tax=Chryseobacterium taichungense TaxID=295069 RepID=A0A1H7X8B0_9FLAO|nr:T9SS type A sorting domain-containing protein [Chryseobacterium taichungense]SEM30112.1 glucuronoarabinoxylan endo-1,4-beta-xylanase [Chryseobacterium taichungense]
MRKILNLMLALAVGITCNQFADAQTALPAKVTIDKNIVYQKVTGYGGFVCSPQFAYNHMTPAEIQKLWGTGTTDAGYNILRLYIPENQADWPQVLATAQQAKAMGLIVFASPWTMPAAWKTNNNSNAVFTDTNGVQQIGYLKPEHYQDYALHLNSFVTYLANNGVALDYISIQNEPDEMAQYAGCIWTPTQIANFVRDYGQLINCNVIAPESVGFTDNFANAFLNTATMANFEVYGGHQYGSMQSVYKQFQANNKQIWQTEYLINWNSNASVPARDFSWSIDGFSFARAVNNAMLGNVNAWVHYASKRYYGMMGDGTNGTVAGEMTKRGYILSQYAKTTTNKNRIDTKWEVTTGSLEGSSYISLDGNQVTLMVINSSSNTYNLKVDLPFYTNSANSITTSQTQNMTSAPLTFTTDTFRPQVSVAPSSVMTFVFTKSGDRPVSNMTGTEIHYNKIETLATTNPAFGTAYQISGQTVTFYNSTPLFSQNMTAANGYIALNDRYNKLVLNVLSYTTTLGQSSSNTTLYYVDNDNVVRNYNYGSVSLPAPGSGSFNLVFDLSRATLPFGCKGILGLRSGNYSSILTLNLGDVYFNVGNERAAKFTGAYTETDSSLLDAMENNQYTSLDFRTATGITPTSSWIAGSENKNSIFYVNSSVANTNTNVISGTNCTTLTLSDQGKDFQVPFNFTAAVASYSRIFNGYDVLLLPFEANIPSGVNAYLMTPGSAAVSCTPLSNTVPANTPVLVNATGSFTFTGTGNVSTPKAITVNQMNGVYQAIKVPANAYVLKTENGVTGFYKVTVGSEPLINPFRAYLSEENAYSASVLPLNFSVLSTKEEMTNNESKIYPNPAKTEIFIEIKNDAKASVFDSKGSLIISDLKMKSGKNRIDISTLTSGIYFIEIADGKNKILNSKFIKQ